MTTPKLTEREKRVVSLMYQEHRLMKAKDSKMYGLHSNKSGILRCVDTVQKKLVLTLVEKGVLKPVNETDEDPEYVLIPEEK